MPEGDRQDAGRRTLILIASLVIVIAGLKASGSIVVPVLASAMIAVLCIPAVNRLKSWSVPEWASVAIVFMAVLVAIVGLSLLVGDAVADFRAELADTDSSLNTGVEKRKTELLELAPPALKTYVKDAQELVDVERFLDAVAKTAGALADLLSNTFFVLLTVVFILGEAAGFPRKLRAAAIGTGGVAERYAGVVGSVREYIRIKAYVSLATGALASLLVSVADVRYAVLWGLAAFVLNFVPTIGSMIAAIPAVLLAYIEWGWQRALAVTIGYFVINTVMGNVIEPKMMGRKLGLSSLVVWLSLVFWGWVWGPIGMLLSVPLTMIVKIFLEHSEDLRWIAVLLGPAGGDEAGRPKSGVAAAAAAAAAGAPATPERSET